MSTTRKVGRSLPIAGVAALLVVGASFAHDSAPSAPTPSTTTREVGTGDDDREIDALAGTVWDSENGQGDEDDLAGKAQDDSEAGDQDENEQGENEDQNESDHQAAPEAPKPAKTHKAKPVTHFVAAHHSQDAKDDGDDAEDNDGAEDGEHDGEHDGSHDGEHDDGGHDGSDGSDDGGEGGDD
jgi:hypothetical protein